MWVYWSVHSQIFYDCLGSCVPSPAHLHIEFWLNINTIYLISIEVPALLVAQKPIGIKIAHHMAQFRVNNIIAYRFNW